MPSSLVLTTASLEMAVTLHGIDQNRDKRPKPLTADAIARLPQHRQRLMYRLVVKSPAWTRAWWCPWLIQHAQRVFAMIAGYSYELVQDLPRLPPFFAARYRSPTASSSSRRVAMLSCLAISSSTPQLRCRVAVYVRQQAPTR